MLKTGGGGQGERGKSFSPGVYYPLKSAVGYSEKGYASWYGSAFHGRPTASGEIYDQNAMTCAHRILPFGTTLRVTNLSNKKNVLVRVNDRGPFSEDRVIDLSKSAASKLNIIGPGTAKVFLEYVDPNPRSVAAKKEKKEKPSYFIQLGAFSVRDNADRLAERLAQNGYTGRTFFGSNGLWNVQVGPYADDSAIKNVLASLADDFPQAFVIAK